jgi:RNA polymerase sigma-70 factor (ECF subfamily)
MLMQPQDAEDAVMEAVLSAYENIHKLRKDEAFRAWIFQILTNVCRRKLRQRKRQHVVTQENNNVNAEGRMGAEMGQSLHMATEPDHSTRLDVQNAFFILSEEEQTIVALSVFGGYNSSEIAQMLKLNANTVRSKRSRALDKMECVLQ